MIETPRKPVTLMYFCLNYCDEDHIEKIPVAMKDIDHLFCMAAEIIETDKFTCFCFLTELELMIINT